MKQKQPSVIIVTTDQQRADVSAREGFALDTTPFLDRLAAEGAWFNRAYTSMPVCAPARVSMLTGRFPSATHVRTNHNIADAHYTKDLFGLFAEAGYRTGLCGKNHSHLTRDRVDCWTECGHLGFDEPVSEGEDAEFEKWLKQTHFHLSLEPTPYPIECQIPYRLVDTALSWVDDWKDDPFLLWLSFPEPHNPYQVSEPYFSMFDPESLPPTLSDESALPVKGFKYEWCREMFEMAFPGFAETIPHARANYFGMLRLIDDQLKRFVEALEAGGRLEDTIIVVLSDHGDFVGEYGLMRKGPGVSEPLVRIPLQFFGAGISESAEPLDAHVSIVDILPTLCDAARLDKPAGVQGRSLWPMLTGGQYDADEFRCAYVEHGFGGEHYTGGEPLDPSADGFTPAVDGAWGAFDCLNSRTQSGSLRAVVMGDWKLVFDVDGKGELYNIVEDKAELHNLFEVPECQAVAREMLKELITWQLRTQDPLPLPRTRYVPK